MDKFVIIWMINWNEMDRFIHHLNNRRFSPDESHALNRGLPAESEVTQALNHLPRRININILTIFNIL